VVRGLHLILLSLLAANKDTRAVTLSSVVMLVLAVGSLAALIPATRAALAEPAQVLRAEWRARPTLTVF
jgi:ABC-type lipoprotein release transport system permease subunit